MRFPALLGAPDFGFHRYAGASAGGSPAGPPSPPGNKLREVLQAHRCFPNSIVCRRSALL